MAITGKFEADFSKFYDAVTRAEVSLRGMETGAGKVESSLNRMVDNFSGRKIIQDATLMAEAVERIGGTSKLTESELARVSATAGEAAAKMKAMGIDVPPKIQAIADTVRSAHDSTGTWTESLNALGRNWVVRIAEGVLLRDAIRGIIDKVKEMAGVLPELALKGAAVADVEENFKRLTEQAGLLGDALIGSLRSGTHSTITDFELMKTVNKDLAAGMRLTDVQFGTLAKGAFALAQATGGDVKTALETMNDAMLTGRTRALALLTGKIDLEKAETRFAASLGKTRENLTDAGKLEAARVAILQAVGAATSRLGEQMDGLDERVAQANVAWSNFQENLGKTIATSKVVEAGMDRLKQSLIQAFGGSQEALIQAIATKVDQLAILIVDLGLASTQAATVMVTAWAAIQVPILAVETALVGVVAGFASLDAGFEKLLAHLPGAAKGQQAVADTAAQTAREWDAMTLSLRDQTAEAVKAVVGQSAVQKAIDKSAGILFTMRDAMLAAKAATTALIKPLDDVTKAHGAAAAAAGEQADALIKLSPAEEAAAKKFAEALAENNAVGKDYTDTLRKMGTVVVASIEEALAAGVSQGTLATLYHKTADEIKAVASNTDDLAGKQAALTAATNEYYKAVTDASHDSVQKQIDGAYLAAAAQIAAMEKAKTYSVEAEMMIWKAAEKTADNIIQKHLEADTNSRAHFVKLADEAQIAYDRATKYSQNYTEGEILRLRDAADAAAIMAARWGMATVSAANQATAAIDKTTASLWREVDAAVAAMTAATGGAVISVGQRPAAITDVGFGTSIGTGFHPLRAAGGPVSPGTSYWVGERGPELFTPDMSGVIDSAGTTKAMVKAAEAVRELLGSKFMADMRAAQLDLTPTGKRFAAMDAKYNELFKVVYAQQVASDEAASRAVRQKPSYMSPASPVIPKIASGGCGCVTVAAGAVQITVNGSMLGTKEELARLAGDAVMSGLKNKGVRFPTGA